MRVLLDEQLPRPLARELVGHDVRTVQGERWSGLKNGELLRHAVADGFEALITSDQSLEFQQNLSSVALGSSSFVHEVTISTISVLLRPQYSRRSHR